MRQLVFSFVLLLILTTILALTTTRRLHDAKLSKNWLVAPSITFLIAGIVIILTGHSSSYWLLIIPTLCAGLLLTYPSKGKHHYILGYFGPIDLSEYQNQAVNTHVNRHRIEPKLSIHHHTEQTAVSINNSHLTSTNINTSKEQQERGKSFDIGELIRLKILDKKNARITVIAGIGTAIVAVLISLLNSAFTNDDVEHKLTEVKERKTPIRTNLLAMPDNFSLYSTQYKGVIIHWQADEVETNQLWSQLSATGDESCKAIQFNKGDDIRTLSVLVENGIDYYANFSPLDNSQLVQALAFRGKFTLCGYSFSLKGSQAALSKNGFYANFVKY